MYCREANMRSRVQKRWSVMATAVFCGRRLRELCQVQGDCGRDDNHEIMYDVNCAERLLSSPELVESVFFSPNNALHEPIPSSCASFYSAPDEPIPDSHASFLMDSKKDEALEIMCDVERAEILLSPASIELVEYVFFSPNGDPDEPILSSDASFFMVSLDCVFPLVNLLLEVLSEVFNQISSKRRPYLGLVGMLTSLATLIVCIIELVYRACKEKVAWRKNGMIYWFFDQNGLPFGTLNDAIALICSILQCVFASIAYISFCKDDDDPIKLSFWPIIFAFGLLCSKIFNKTNSGIETEPRPGP